jgi:hypothetical protein
MELTQGSETSANYNYKLTPGKYPKEHIQYTNHGESLKSTVMIRFHNFAQWVLTDCFSPLAQQGQTIGLIVTRSSRKFFGTFPSKNLDYLPTNPSREEQCGDFSWLFQTYNTRTWLYLLYSLTDLKNYKAQFKAALRKYLNTHSFYSVDEFVMYKDDL